MKIALIGTALLATALLMPVPKEADSDGDQGPERILDRDSARYFLTLARTEEAARRPNAAWGFYERAAHYDPQDREVLQGLISVTTLLRKPGATLAAMEKLQATQPSDAEGARTLAETYFSRNDWPKTIQWGTQALKLSPNTPGLDYMVGVAHHNRRDYNAALPYLRRAVANEPERADAHYYLARGYIQQGAYARSVPHYEKTLALDPQPLRAYEYALALSTVGEPEKSVQWFSKALELGYDAKDDFYTNMAYALSDAKQTKQAISTLRGVLVKRPHDQNIMFALAEMHYQAGDYREAIRYWDDVLKEDKENARALFMIGKCYIAMGKTNEGQQLCNKAIEMEPALASLRQERMLR